MLLIVLGLAIGAVAATLIGNILRARNAYPRAVMVIMGHHTSRLRAQLRAGRCPFQANGLHMRRLQAVSQDIIPAFSGADGGIDPAFAKLARRLRKALSAEISRAPASCADLSTSMQRIGNICHDCHQRFR